ncbi:MAG: hypothetical protein JO220_18515 [Hyphomicrobiales bacterium]|nr:hypothetical protein [Hyphomicrobiales bacterium]
MSDLHAQGRFSPKRVVVDASRFHHQKELIGALRSAGTQIVLDTKAAELSAASKFSGFAQGAPWASAAKDKPLSPDHFRHDAPGDVIGQIARFAVQNRVHAVLSPSHFLSKGSATDWFRIDLRACCALREALDRAGGRHIGIDYLVLIPHVALDDLAERGQILASVKNLPFDNLWIRASGFGADSGPLTTRRYINSLSRMNNLGKPIVADYLGGLVSLAAEAFGSISGFAEGVGERERFDAREWHKSPKPRDDDDVFGHARRVTIAGFGRTVTCAELAKLCEAKGGRRLVACTNRSCCPHGLSDVLVNPKRHSLNYRSIQIRSLEQTPDLSRPQHFLDGEMTRADRLSRQIKELKTGDDLLTKRLTDHSHRMEKLRATLEHFQETRGANHPRALPIVERGNVAEHQGADSA